LLKEVKTPEWLLQFKDLVQKMLHSVIEEHLDMLRELTCPQRTFPRALSNRFQIAIALIVELEPQPQILLK
jgi:hypothetical protein